jgi:hypothetical protein
VARFSGNNSFILGDIMNYGKQMFALAFVLSGAFLFTRNIYAEEAAFFREVSGTVEIKAPDSAVWANAVTGDRIEKSTLISIGFKSTAALVVGDSVITVRPVTRLSLEEIIRSQTGEQVNLYLQSGRIRVEVKPPVGGKTDFTVRSPIATASVRGTSFDFDTENLRVDEGRVQYSLANGRQVYVAAGGMSYVDEPGNTVVSPFQAAAEFLVPAPPLGSGSGSPVRDNTPAITPPGSQVGVGFGWE